MTPAAIIASALCAVDGIEPEAASLVGMKTMRAWQARLPKAEIMAAALKAAGFAVVPVEPTEEIGVTGARSLRDTMRWDNFTQRGKHAWTAMIRYAMNPTPIGDQSGQWHPEPEPLAALEE